MSDGIATPRSADPRWAFAELGRILLDQPLNEVLERVTHLVKDLLPHAVDVSVTLLEEHGADEPSEVKARSVAFHGDLAVDLDERQYEDGFGPCMDAAATGQVISVDTAVEERYAHFADRARRRGVTHTLSVGLPIPQQTIGALNLYGSGGAFTDEEVVLAQTFAGFAAVALSNAAALSNTADLAKNLRIAMESRAVIEQAKGMIMIERHCGPDEAFDVLRRASQHHNVKLRTVCQSMVEAASSAAGRPSSAARRRSR